MTNPTPEQIEQCAQLCYAAQRELLLTRGLATVSQTVPHPWGLATDSDRHAARVRVVDIWRSSAMCDHAVDAPFEEILTEEIVWACRAYSNRTSPL